jgi:hypothetical protein
MVKHERAHYTLDMRVRKWQTIGERLVELKLGALRERLRTRSFEDVRIAVNANQLHARGGTRNRERHCACATTQIQDPHRSSGGVDRSLDEAWTPHPLPHHHRVDRIVERRKESTASRRNVSVAHVAASLADHIGTRCVTAAPSPINLARMVNVLCLPATRESPSHMAGAADTPTRSSSYYEETTCAACGRVTETIGGRCPNCGEVKDARRMPVSTPIPTGSFWSDLDDWVQMGLVIAPLVVLTVLGAILLAPEIAIVAAILIVGYVLLSGLLDFF